MSSDKSVINILHIEDNLGDARLLKSILNLTDDIKYTLTHVTCLEDGITLLNQSDCKINLILLDLCLPESQGEVLIERIRVYAYHIPIIVLSGMHNENTALKAIENGAQDFLQKTNLEPNVIARAIRYATYRKQSELKLTHLAKHDPLTNLANRTLFYDRLEQAILRNCRNEGLLALLFIDLDKFKCINDQFGHHVGDELLKQFSLRVKQHIRIHDTFARLSGDEFTIILEDCPSKEAVNKVTEDIKNAVAKPFYIENKKITVTCSIGVSLNNKEHISSDALVFECDTAMYQAKENGRNNFKYFTPEMSHYIESRKKFVNELEHALNTNKLHLDYQQQYDCDLGRIIGAEALIRWHHPTKGYIKPVDFIPILEETGLINKAGNWVLNNACQQWHEWQMQGKVSYESIISVNISPKQFSHSDFIYQVKSALEHSGLAPDCLDLEITENILLEDTEYNQKTLEQLKAIGVKLTIDDFGIGFSSLSYLKHFPVDRLKIDKSFIDNIIDNKKDFAICNTIINLAKNLHLEVVAEGVDNADKANKLYSIGCHLFQGYYYGKPESSNNFIHSIIDHAAARYVH